VAKKLARWILLPGETRFDCGSARPARPVTVDGTIVGFASTSLSAPTNRALIYTLIGGMQDLDELIDANSGWVLTTPAAINDQGQIVGWGNKGGFLQTPIPEPAALPLLVVGGATVLARRHGKVKAGAT
jgi:hypothetical protein